MAATVDPRDTSGWDRAKRRALRRDQHRCRYCGHTEADIDGLDLHVHHILPVANGGDNALENLATLCKRCHDKIHQRHDGDGKAPLSLLEEDRPSFKYPTDRRFSWDYSETEESIIHYLKENGLTQLKELDEELDCSYQYLSKKMRRLRRAGYVARVRRGVYSYISEVDYWRIEEQRRNGNDVMEFHIWDSGEQVQLSEFVENTDEQ